MSHYNPILRMKSLRILAFTVFSLAAGLAAAVSLRKGVLPHELNWNDIKEGVSVRQ